MKYFYRLISTKNYVLEPFFCVVNKLTLITKFLLSFLFFELWVIIEFFNKINSSYSIIYVYVEVFVSIDAGREHAVVDSRYFVLNITYFNCYYFLRTFLFEAEFHKNKSIEFLEFLAQGSCCLYIGFDLNYSYFYVIIWMWVSGVNV